MSASDNKTVTFIQYDLPPLKSGAYNIIIKQTVNQSSPNSFESSAQFAVSGERFTFDPADLHCVFPPDLANGEYSGVLPHVVFSRRTLPWERDSGTGVEAAPWLAVLLFNEDEAPIPQQLTAKDLVPAGQQITVAGSTTIGVGTLPTDYLSYPKINQLDYGESPDDKCLVIDLPLELFNKITPSAEDLPYLAHIREIDTTDSEDNLQSTIQYAIVLGNRVSQDNLKSCVFLVSLENMGAYLPNSDGTASAATAQLSVGTHVRLITYRSWSYVANTMGETFQTLLENLNKSPNNPQRFSTLQYPFIGASPTPNQVQLALNHQANGTLTDADAKILLFNAFQMGYVPLNHHLRHAGQTVSFYRGPLVPYPVATTISVPLSCSDAANQYNPQTGMFDVSYGAAWQLGQLLALQNTAYAMALYNWKKAVAKSEVVEEEQNLINQRLQPQDQSIVQPPVLESFCAKRTTKLTNSAVTDPPDLIVNWIAALRLLNGVPFQYLVPDESMLPPESLRFFYLDDNWMNALIDGAYSIGRASTGELQQDARTIHGVHRQAKYAARLTRRNPRPLALSTYHTDTEQITGFLLRSQVVSGWPGLKVNGYSDTTGNTEAEIIKLCMRRLSNDVLLCLFDGVAQMAVFHEPPEQLHCGVEGTSGQATTTLRAVTGTKPGQQYLANPKGGNASAPVPSRVDNQTLMINSANAGIYNKLNSDFNQGLTSFTSAEFALEMVKGVVKVEFQQGN